MGANVINISISTNNNINFKSYIDKITAPKFTGALYRVFPEKPRQKNLIEFDIV